MQRITLLDIISRSVLALDHEHTRRDIFLRSRSQSIFMSLVTRGHDCYVVIFTKLTKVNREGNVFVRFIKMYLGGNDVRWVILQWNTPPHSPWWIHFFTLRIFCACYSKSKHQFYSKHYSLYYHYYYATCEYPIRWSQVLSWEWRCSWSSADRRCSNYIWVTNKSTAY